MSGWMWLRWAPGLHTLAREWPFLGGQEGGPTKQRTPTLKYVYELGEYENTRVYE